MKRVHEYIAPTPEELWDRGGASMQNVMLEDGRHVTVPFFNLEISDIQQVDESLLWQDTPFPTGVRYEYAVTMSDGIDRSARVYVPSARVNDSFDATLHADTAWMTTTRGHNDWVAARLVAATKQPMIVVGAEHSSERGIQLGNPLNARRLMGRAATISLAKSAQSSALITRTLMDVHGLEDTVIKTGESRGAMLAPAHVPYGQMYGYRVGYGDTTAPCVPKRLFTERHDALHIAGWPLIEALGTIALAAPMVMRNHLSRHHASLSISPRFAVSNIAGVAPALFSGEAGRFAEWWPHTTPLHVATFSSDYVSRPEVWRELYAEHEHVHIHEYKSGTHMTLAHPEVVDRKAARMTAALQQLRTLRIAGSVNWHEDVFSASHHRKEKPAQPVAALAG